MIEPLYQFQIKGVLWYLGEENSKNRKGAVQYETLLQDLVVLWRKNWGNESLPFLVVQLPGFGKATPRPRSSDNWPWIHQPVRGRIIAPDKGRVEHPGIENSSAIRYAWENFPNCNLYGEWEMPAFPFRTHHESGAL